MPMRIKNIYIFWNFSPSIHVNVCVHAMQLWLSVLMFSLGFLTDGGISMIGLISMDVVPTQMSGSAHGLACAMAQGAARAATLHV